jgi:hypothetical protein
VRTARADLHRGLTAQLLQVDGGRAVDKPGCAVEGARAWASSWPPSPGLPASTAQPGLSTARPPSTCSSCVLSPGEVQQALLQHGGVAGQPLPGGLAGALGLGVVVIAAAFSTRTP